MTTAVASGARTGSFRRKRAPLAALPNPQEQERLAEQADRRAREALAAAEAAGRPLVDRAGRKRSPVTLPEYRTGCAPANKGRRFPVEVLTPEEVLSITDVMPLGPAGRRNRALVIVMWRAGLRVAEALALLPKDLDLVNGLVNVLDGKGAKQRIACIDPGAARYIEPWLTIRAKLGIGEEAPLFCTVARGHVGHPVQSSTVREMLKLYARKAGVYKRVHPHGLRHTHAFELSQEDVPVNVIQKQLGHNDLAMTARYIDHLSPKHLRERIIARTFPGQEKAPAAPPPVTTAARSGGAQAPATPFGRHSGDPKEPERSPAPKWSAQDRAEEVIREVLRVLNGNGGAATQEQLRRTLDICAPTLDKAVAALQERELIKRAGVGHRRSVIWHTKNHHGPAGVQPPDPKGAPIPKWRQQDRADEMLLRVLDAIAENGGSATQGQLRRALNVSAPTLLKHLHRLHEQERITRAGFDRNRSLVWKTAPPKVVVNNRRVSEYRRTPNGEGPKRVLDALDGAGGRASQAELGRLLGIESHTVHSHCLELEAEGLVERGGLDKSTSRRGSQIWRIRREPARFQMGGGYTMKLPAGAR